MRVVRKLLARWTVFNAMTRVLARRNVSRETFMPMIRQALLLDTADTSELTFDDMVGIVYRGRPLREAVILQMTNAAAFWRCRAELAADAHDRDAARRFESIVTEAASDLADRLDDRSDAWVPALIEARSREERTHHPDYVAPRWHRLETQGAAPTRLSQSA